MRGPPILYTHANAIPLAGARRRLTRPATSCVVVFGVVFGGGDGLRRKRLCCWRREGESKMRCFSCIGPRRRDGRRIGDSTRVRSKPRFFFDSASEKSRQKQSWDVDDSGGKERASCQSDAKSSYPSQKSGAACGFSFRELAIATKNFKPTNLIGEGGFGPVYRGRMETGQVVAIKQLNREGLQGNQEFIVEVLMLSLFHHPNLVKLVGYCAEGDQRLLVYEYMTKGSLENHLFALPPEKEPLGWNTRMKIAVGAAHGLEYLHVKANPPVIYRDLKSANILLDDDFNPKLSDFGLAKLGPVGDNTHVSTRVMGTYGYCAPEYAKSGKLTLKSDVYSFGVLLLELITGRKSIDNSRAQGERELVLWSRQFLRDRRKFSQLADPLLEGRYPAKCLHHAVAITQMCLAEEAPYRPLIGDVVVALEYLASKPYISEAEGLKRSPQSRLSPASASRLNPQL